MKRIIVVSIVIIFIALISTILLKKMMVENDYEKKGEEIINIIELYRKETNKLPENLGELNYSENMQEGPHYIKIDSIIYQVYYSIGFDDYYVYDSKEEVWKKTN